MAYELPLISHAPVGCSDEGRGTSADRVKNDLFCSVNIKIIIIIFFEVSILSFLIF